MSASWSLGGERIGREDLTPVEERFLELAERAGKLGEEGEGAPEDGEAGGEGDAAIFLGGMIGFLHRRGWVQRLDFHGEVRWRAGGRLDYFPAGRPEPSLPSWMSMKVVD